MSYQVIARKYRPQRFSDVVGQEHVTQTLSNAITQNRIAHAYLFCGPRGTGKTTIARIFAKCLNCTDGPKVEFDENDPRCQEIIEGRSLDVIEIDGASNNKVEDVHELRDGVRFAPASSKFKIFIIDEVHMLSTAAFNALLKTLEEPPAHVKFMFATTDPEKVLATILSRCQRFDLRRIPVPLIIKQLAHIAEQEKVAIDEAALYAIARGCDGGMRDAESALDQLISFCGEKIVESDVLSMYGLSAQSQILTLASGILNGEAETVLRELNALAKHGKDLGRLLSDLLNYFRNLLIFQVSRGDLKLLEISELEASSLKDQAASISTEALTRIMEVLTEAEGRLRDAASKKIFVEVALLKAMQSRNSVSLETVLKQLQQLKSGGGSAPAAPSAPVPRAVTTPAAKPAEAPRTSATPPVTPVVSAPAPVAATAQGQPDLESLWQNVLEAVGRVSGFTRSYLLQAHPVSFAKNVFTIGYDPEFSDQLDLVNNPKTQAVLQTKLGELGHAGAQIKFIIAESQLPRAAVQPTLAPTPATPAPARQSAASAPAAAAPKHEKPAPISISAEEFKNDPLIQKALEVFKGTIVEVRA